jgi:hypothetical protein
MAEPSPPDGVQPEFVALIERHTAAMEGGRMADAQECVAAIMCFAAEEAQRNPTPEMLRALLADQAENDGEWDVARRIRQEELDEARRESEPTVRASGEARAMLRLAYIEACQGHHERALELARAAVEPLRGLDWPFLLASFLEPLAGFALRLGRSEEALRAADEGLSLLDDRRTTDHFRAMLMQRRAEALLQSGCAADARASLDSAWHLVEPLAALDQASGVQSTLANGWRLEARLRTDRGDWPFACEAWQRSLDRYRHVAGLWNNVSRKCNVALADVLMEFASAADAAGDLTLAAALREARRQIPL